MRFHSAGLPIPLDHLCRTKWHFHGGARAGFPKPEPGSPQLVWHGPCLLRGAAGAVGGAPKCSGPSYMLAHGLASCAIRRLHAMGLRFSSKGNAIIFELCQLAGDWCRRGCCSTLTSPCLRPEAVLGVRSGEIRIAVPPSGPAACRGHPRAFLAASSASKTWMAGTGPRP